MVASPASRWIMHFRQYWLFEAYQVNWLQLQSFSIFRHAFPTYFGFSWFFPQAMFVVFYFWVYELTGNVAWEPFKWNATLSNLPLFLSYHNYKLFPVRSVMCETRKKIRAFGACGLWEMVKEKNKMTTLHLKGFGCTTGVTRLWDLDFRELSQPVSWQ
jgi:hypothetical protein